MSRSVPDWIFIAFVIVALAVLGVSIRFAWWRRTVPYDRPRILMYHMVREPIAGAKFNKLRVPPGLFEKQLAWLARNGWQFCFVSDLAQAEPKSVAITFDDGYRDNYVAADPLLARYDAVATLYLVVDRFDRDWSTTKKAHHDSGELMREDKLSDAEIRSMLASGRWEIGAHTVTHALLPELAAQDHGVEIVTSKTAIEEAFCIAAESFAYPFGIFDARDVEAVSAAGFRYAMTTDQGIADDLDAAALTLPRVKISGTEGLRSFALRMRTGRRGAFS